MITQSDLDAAIAECQGQRNPNAGTCLKLAAYYTIKDKMYGAPPGVQSYSYAAGPTELAENPINYSSGTEFSEAIDGHYAEDIWPIVDEAMTALKVFNPRLYAGVLRKINEL